MGHNMTIVQMQYFAAVCQYGSISRSAEALHISQPSVSMAIKDLEREFGIVLFHRENKQLKISPEGMYINERVKDILSRVNALETHMAEIGSQQNHPCLVLPNFTGKLLLSTLLDDVSREHPDIRFEVKQCSASVAVKMLENGSCDLAIIVESDTVPDNLEIHRVLSSEFVYCVHTGHHLAAAKMLSLPEVCHEPLILNQEESFMTRQIKKRFYDSGLVPNILLYAAQLPLIEEFVCSGKAGTFLCKELAEMLPGVAAIPLTEKIPVNFSLVWMKDKTLSKKTWVLLNHIKAKCPVTV